MMVRRRTTDWDAAVARWRRVAELGTELGLCDAGCSEGCIAEILGHLDSAETFNSRDSKLERVLSMLTTTKNGPAVLLATLGRGNSSGLKRVELSSSYKFLSIDSEATALCVNLSSNVAIKELRLNSKVFGTPQGCANLATALKSNSTVEGLSLRGSNIGSKAVRFLMNGLEENQTLTSLDLSGNPLSDDGIGSVAEFLRSNCNATLKVLDLQSTKSGFQGANQMASALECNTTLEELHFGGNRIGRDGMNRLLAPLSGRKGDHDGERSSDSRKNKTLKKLHLRHIDQEDFSVESVAKMIRTNKTLSSLDLGQTRLSPEDWKEEIFPALRENGTLEELDLSYCGGLTEDVLENLIDLLQLSATGLRKLNLHSDLATGLGVDTTSWQQARVDEELRLNLLYRSKLMGQTQVPTTTGRLVLCGPEFSGKSAILKTMERIEHGDRRGRPLSKGPKTIEKMARGLRMFMCGCGKDSAQRELTTGTRGFDVLVLRTQGNLASVWDFAGQRDNHALYDGIFSKAIINSTLLYVCSSRCPPDLQNPRGKLKDQSTMEAECEYWMRFIAANSKPRLSVRDPWHHPKLPQVRFVLTHTDTLEPTALNLAKQHAERVVDKVKCSFQDVVALSKNVEVVNAHSSKDVERLISLANISLGEVLEDQREYVVGKEVYKEIESWSTRNPSTPLLSLAEFETICRNQLRHLAPLRDLFEAAKLHSSAGREAILSYLNDKGDVIFGKGLDFVVANPRWFGLCVLGSMIDALREGVEDLQDQPRVSKNTNDFVPSKRLPKLQHSQGFVDRPNLKLLLEHSLQWMSPQQTVPFDDVIKLMIYLELCFETQPGNADSSIFFPALFQNSDSDPAAMGKRRLEWKLKRAEPLNYLGRRLECENKSLGSLTPGFFPRFQVHLHNYVHQRKWTANPGFEVGRNLICFERMGVEVCVEYYNGDMIIDHPFVDILVRYSAPSSVALQFIEEHVVKPTVQFCASPQGCQGVRLVDAVIRPLCVQRLLSCADRKPHSVPVTELRARLAKDDAAEHTWSHKIGDMVDTEFARDLLEGGGSQKSFVEGQLSKLAPEIASSRVASRSEELFSNVELPKLFYPSIEDVGWLRKLDHRMDVAKVMPIKLHLMCDHEDGSHKVDSQPGRTMKLNWKEDSNHVPLAKLAMRLLWASIGTVNLPEVDTWIQNLFDVPEMPNINVDTLKQLLNRGDSRMPVSEPEILKALERYWKIDPYNEGLKKVLKLQDGGKFWQDFRLRKVVYKAPNQSKVGWVCEHHFNCGIEAENITVCASYVSR